MALLFAFAREYQMERLHHRCVEFLNEDVATTPDGDSHLLDLLVIASEHSLTDHLERLIPKVAHLKMTVIMPIHEKVDHGVLAAVYLAKAQKSEAILTSLPRPATSSRHDFFCSDKDAFCCISLNCTPSANCPRKFCWFCRKYFCRAHESIPCVRWSTGEEEKLRCQRCRTLYADGCACDYGCPKDLIAHMKTA